MFGVVFVSAILIVAITIPEPSRFQYEVFKIVLAVAVAGVAAFIPGFLNVEIGSWLRAGGAMAVFVVVYFYSPATLVVEQPIGLDAKFLKLKEESQNLWHDWSELGDRLSAAESGKYLALGNSLSNIDDASLNQKTQILKYDRASLMFLLASEIVISSGAKQPDLIESAILTSKKSVRASDSGIAIYNKVIGRGPTQEEREWVIREQPNLVLIQRRAEALAQLAYLLPNEGGEYKKKLEDSLSALSCDYVQKYKLGEQKQFLRIGTPQTIARCLTPSQPM